MLELCREFPFKEQFAVCGRSVLAPTVAEGSLTTYLSNKWENTAPY